MKTLTRERLIALRADAENYDYEFRQPEQLALIDMALAYCDEKEKTDLATARLAEAEATAREAGQTRDDLLERSFG